MRARSELGKVRVPKRVYSEPDRFGHRTLLHGAGSYVPWSKAVELGFVDGESRPPDDLILVVLPIDLFEDAPQGGRQLVHRKGTLISLAQAKELGLNLDVKEEDDVKKDGEEPRTEEKAPPTTTTRQQPPRTTKGADPKAPNPR